MKNDHLNYKLYLQEMVKKGLHPPANNSVFRGAPSGDRHIVIKQNGKHKRYRINKYGEMFEE